jgi:hypothetical protein
VGARHAAQWITVWVRSLAEGTNRRAQSRRYADALAWLPPPSPLLLALLLALLALLLAALLALLLASLLA